MSTVKFPDLLDDLRERAQKGELTVSPEGWAELEEVVGKREVGFPSARMRSHTVVARD